MKSGSLFRKSAIAVVAAALFTFAMVPAIGAWAVESEAAKTAETPEAAGLAQTVITPPLGSY